eukprot:2810252-Pyramimonas_sp.AAC.1
MAPIHVGWHCFVCDGVSDLARSRARRPRVAQASHSMAPRRPTMPTMLTHWGPAWRSRGATNLARHSRVMIPMRP